MQLYPAIDLLGGQAVRLQQGDYARVTVYGDPVAFAKRWVAEGATHLHLVDLDGARDGRRVNGDVVRAIVDAAGVPCQLGGGLRTEEDIETVLSWGVTRAIVGTRALQSREWLDTTTHSFPGQIVLGIDAKNGMVATHGWLDVSKTTAIELAQSCQEFPLAAIVYTDISRDGMLQGVNVEAMQQMARAVTVPVIASGGFTSLADIENLLPTGVVGCILGKALYEGRVALREVVAMISGK
jgi:phosphoribosylformimino-5-aminoimidazole carboxamide ribotide isomerase